ncbi:MAG TPA: undecaprenyl-diphosphate phosphatase [Egibacteraceae bacterium]|nr:undecaprenyl-diphosphate phosphatase [Egibacteraceae bacterium]HVM14585.1 undecaprenyl-diphosphate phosphatase [Egibacteraceae bacterium]HVM19042.1 undecaprenyl-diphosphate phosphatase [Egibacteraceae bacterium]
MPPWLQAVILGIVQGLTEFIPVSSSGHLVIVPYLAGWERPGLAFDVALHIGSAAAVILYFHRELLAMARGVVLGGRDPDGRIYRRLAVFLVIGSVPVAVAGFLLEDLVSEVFEQPLFVAGFLLVTAALLLGAERVRGVRVRQTPAPAGPDAAERRVWTGSWVGPPGDAEQAAEVTLPVGADGGDPRGRTLETLGLRHVLVVGLIQMMALMPGISRSGATISAGMMSGLTREAATRFSFLLSLPALLGAFIVSLPGLAEPGPYSGMVITGGVIASFVASYAAVRFLVRLVSRDRLTPFARYCLFVAVVTVIAYQFLGPPSSV